MQRKRGELVPIGDALSGRGGPVKAIREATPQARHHFTLADQVNQLVSANEADADLGFMARTMALCSLPRTNPGNRKEYKRVNGPYTLIMFLKQREQAPFWQSAAPIASLAVYRSGTDPKPCADPGVIAFRFHG